MSDDAIRAVRDVLLEFVEFERQTAENSHSQWIDGKKVWNGKLWRQADAYSYALCARGRRAINALADTSTGNALARDEP